MITVETFGLSGTGNDVMKHFGFTVNNVKKEIKKLINKNR
jgi:transketolase